VRKVIVSVAVVLLLSASAVVLADDYRVLYSLGAGTGAGPNGLVLSGSTLYGETTSGGPNGTGTIFRIGANGAGFYPLYPFGAASINGGLTTDGSRLYGYYAVTGAANTVAADMDGSGYTLLHGYTSEVGKMVVSGTTIYGMTHSGGNNSVGSIYSMNTDGTGLQTLHSFSWLDGDYPYGSLTLIGSTLYGTTWSGGTGGEGTVFKMNTNSGDYAVLHNFSGGANDGANPWGGLTLLGSYLYGTAGGGDTGGGTVFGIKVDGSDFHLLHTFAGGAVGPGTENCPNPDLALVGETLYGTTARQGNTGSALFAIDAAGNYRMVHEFTGVDGGAGSGCVFATDGTTLYGATAAGGPSGGGTIFALTVPEPSTLACLGIGAIVLAGYAHRRRRMASRGC
jgi:uncharacterized repeat protein (TIGR03803 family)